MYSFWFLIKIIVEGTTPSGGFNSLNSNGRDNRFCKNLPTLVQKAQWPSRKRVSSIFIQPLSVDFRLGRILEFGLGFFWSKRQLLDKFHPLYI
jgi:hypothetical protein